MGYFLVTLTDEPMTLELAFEEDVFDSPFEGLCGAEIDSVLILDDRNTVLLVRTLRGDEHYYRTEGDCACVDSYLAGATGTDALVRGALVHDAKVDSAPSVGGTESGSQTDTLFYRISTDKGRCTLELRVEHNGYYGGSIGSMDAYEVDQFKRSEECLASPKPLDDF